MSSSKLNYSKVVCIVSGGADSATLLYDSLRTFDEVNAISFDYGQKHKRELLYAKTLCKKANVEHDTIDLTKLTRYISNSALTSKIKVPHGHYAASNMKATVVPNRNMIMLSIAAGIAINRGIGVVAYGAHSGDHTIYPDCRPAFAMAVREALLNVHFEPLKLHTPFIEITKTDIFQMGKEMKVPYQHTWSCYEGKVRPCLKCGTCQERTIAFRDVDMKDPLLTPEEWSQAIQIVKGIK